MNRNITNAIHLEPVVKKAVKALYGPNMQDVKILKADRFPLFREPKQGWMVHLEFNDGEYDYSVQMDVQMTDGRITRAIELHRHPLNRQV
jgi:hypothetical protein